MAGVSLSYRVDRDTLSPGLRRQVAAGANLAPAMDEIGVGLVANVLDRFEAERGPGGTPWTPSVRARREGGKTLTDRGHLRGSITHDAGEREVEWGSNLVYAAIHQTGGRIEAKGGALKFPVGNGWATVKAVTIPARPYLGFDAADRDVVSDALEAHLARAAGEGDAP